MVAVALAVVVAATACSDGGDGEADAAPGPAAEAPSSTRDDPPGGPGTEPEEPLPGPDESGWYLPADGWEIAYVTGDPLDGGSCPCSFVAAARPGVPTVPLDISESVPGDLPEDVMRVGRERLDVGGRQGWRTPASATSPFTTIYVYDEPLLLTATMAEEDVAVGVTVMDAWLDQRRVGGDLVVDSLPFPEGWVHTGQATAPALDSFHVVTVLARETATGRVIEYQLTPPGVNRRWFRGRSVVADGDGALRLSPLGHPGPTNLGISHELSPDRPVRTVAALIGGPFDVVVGDNYYVGGPERYDFYDEGLEPFTGPEVEAFLDGLRPVGTEEWRATLDAVDNWVDRTAVESRTLLDRPLTRPTDTGR